MRVLGLGIDELRLFLHLLAATVWVGGQVVLAALVPALRRVGPAATQAAARQFNRVAWPFFALAVATGVWNLVAVDGAGDAYRRTLEVKVGVVVLSGAAAFLHTRARSRRAIAALGALSGLTALLALLLGVVLAH